MANAGRSCSRYCFPGHAAMTEDSDEEPQARGVLGFVRERLGVVIGIIGLFAWFALVWFMFGDVL